MQTHIHCGHCDEPYELSWIKEDLALEGAVRLSGRDMEDLDRREALARSSSGCGPIPEDLYPGLQLLGWKLGASRLIIRRCPECEPRSEPQGWLADEDRAIALEIIEEEYVPGGSEEQGILGRILEILSGRIL
jgi:hypothetical protein